MFHSALVALKPGQSNDGLLAYAIDLARRHSLSLGGITILDRELVTPLEPVPLGGMTFKKELDEARIDQAREAMAAALDEFSRLCGAAGISSRCMSQENSLVPDLSQMAQRYDVLLVGRSISSEKSGEASAARLPDILRVCPRPAIVVPTKPVTGAGAVVAYDGSLQSARALQSFVNSGFGEGERIHVVSFNDEEAVAREAAGIARDFLSVHGFSAIESSGPVSGGGLAELIVATYRRLGARLLVMGAYGTSMFREFFFGSVTKDLLAEPDIPIFLDH